MNVELMRQIDKNLGGFFCLVFTAIDGVKKILGFNKVDGPPKKILFLKPAEMGTSIILLPTIKKCKEMFPQAKIYFLTFEENAPILNIIGEIENKNVIKIRADSIFHLMVDTLNSILKLRREKIDTIIDLEFFSRYSTILSYLSGAKRRVGFHRFHSEGLYRGELMTHKVGYNYYLHVGLSFLSLLYALKYPPGRIIIKEKLSIDHLKIPKIKITEKEMLCFLFFPLFFYCFYLISCQPCYRC